MDRWGDQNRKSRHASTVDYRHYPDSGEESSPTHAEISARAYRLWMEQGRRPDSAEENWLRAERELTVSATSRRLVEQTRDQAGSVQR
jgi:hypothetical protein